MRSDRPFQTLLILFTILLALPGSGLAKSAQVDQPAPMFRLPDANGKVHTLKDYLGKRVVLEWVNFDCPFVKKHYDSGNMQKLQTEYTAKEVVWLSICSSAKGKQGQFPPEKIRALLAEKKAAPTAYLIDVTGGVGEAYGAKTTPHMFIIDAEGKLTYAGAIDDKPTTDVNDIPKAKNFVRAVLDDLLAGKAPALKSATPYGCAVKY